MNLDTTILLWHLKEAEEELQEIIMLMSSSNTQEDEEYWRQRLLQVYHHLNTGWNARHSGSEYWQNQGDAEFATRRQFPEDIRELLLTGNDE